ncbi:hypothetical protein H072_5899 [Dactylellina haptotyla CBS 200.50]|uniref:holo-[acyl-carrier-protein] synthase n=1 Tax=Dactylellina haptotyla (strain CBS 200.50) TaxID=1284197 RepID=S8ABL3_DACHA|nr:hypothetical protein H072_5899 [Dactylellina haptotyla CBS 200.50]
MPLIRWLLNVEPLWNTPEEFTQTLNYLPSSTHSHVLKYFRPSDRKLALGSQILQHLLVSKFRNIPFRDVTIVRNFGGVQGGRPVFVGTDSGVEGLEYNVSHHGGVVAITSRLDPPREDGGGGKDVGGGIGVDVADYEQRPRYIEGNLAAVFEWADGFEQGGVFTRWEMEGATGGLRGMAGDEEGQMEEVVKGVHLNWAVKEAYVKAVGTGLVTDLTAVEFGLEGVKETLDSGERSRGVQLWLGKGAERREGSEWYFEVERVQREGLEGRYCVAIATKAEGLSEEDRQGRWEWLDYEEGIEPVLKA